MERDAVTTTIEAPVSRYKRNNYLIWTVLLIGLAVWFAYDGYKNEKFIAKHTKDGIPDATLKSHRVSPPFMIFGGLVLGAVSLVIRNRKITADDQALQVNKTTIPYERIEAVDKTHFDKKGYFVLTWNNSDQKKESMKLSDRDYDNLPAVLDRIVEKIS